MKRHSKLSEASFSLISQLLEKQPNKRLGCGKTGIAEVKSHPFFASIDWSLLDRKLLNPGIVPELDKSDSYITPQKSFCVGLKGMRSVGKRVEV